MTRFKSAQLKKGYTTQELADKLCVSAQMVYYWREYGIRNWNTASKIGRKLECKPELLIGYTNEN